MLCFPCTGDDNFRPLAAHNGEAGMGLIDLKILAALQEDASLSVAGVAHRAGLSPTGRSELVEILTNLPRHIGFLIIEHDMDVALRVAESVSMMHNGRIFKEGLPSEIESDPEVQELYLGGGHG